MMSLSSHSNNLSGAVFILMLDYINFRSHFDFEKLRKIQKTVKLDIMLQSLYYTLFLTEPSPIVAKHSHNCTLFHVLCLKLTFKFMLYHHQERAMIHFSLITAL